MGKLTVLWGKKTLMHAFVNNNSIACKKLQFTGLVDFRI